MKLVAAASSLALVLVLASVITTSSADDEDDRHSSLPENFVERVEAIVKWFELRISVYRKANILLKQLTKKVSALQPHNDGLDVYYRRWKEYRSEEDDTPQLLRSVNNGTRQAPPVSDMLRKALSEKEVKFILTMMPEVYPLFHKKA